MKRSLTLALAAVATFAAAAPAQAGVVLVGTPGGTMNAGQSASIDFNKTYGGNPVIVIPGLTATLTLKFLSSVLSGGITTFNFDYSIANTSTIAGGSRVTTLGFNVDPNVGTKTEKKKTIALVSVDGTYTEFGSGNVPIFSNYLGKGDVEVCLFAGGSCGGGGGGGPLAGTTGSGKLSLGFNGAINDIKLSNFVVRYQAFNSNGIASAVGISTTVPEPGTWMLMIAGIGLMGWQLRRRRQTVKVSYA